MYSETKVVRLVAVIKRWPSHITGPTYIHAMGAQPGCNIIEGKLQCIVTILDRFHCMHGFRAPIIAISLLYAAGSIMLLLWAGSYSEPTCHILVCTVLQLNVGVSFCFLAGLPMTLVSSGRNCNEK